MDMSHEEEDDRQLREIVGRHVETWWQSNYLRANAIFSHISLTGKATKEETTFLTTRFLELYLPGRTIPARDTVYMQIRAEVFKLIAAGKLHSYNLRVREVRAALKCGSVTMADLVRGLGDPRKGHRTSEA